MNLLLDALAYIADNQERFFDALTVHMQLSLSALLLGCLIFIPLGMLTARSRTHGPQVVALVAATRVIPSLAVLFLLLPWLGTGFTPALVALTLLAGPPLIVNTDAGLRDVDPVLIENATGLGMSRSQVFREIQIPLAMPVVVAGIRSALIEVIASATLAAFIGVRSLGYFILAGMSLIDFRLLLVGAVPVAILALFAEGVLSRVERRLTPPLA